MVERKAFLANPKHQYDVSQRGEHDCSAHNKRIEIIISIQVYLISRITLIIMKMVKTKVVLANPTHQYHVSKYEEHDCYANNKKNGDRYGYPSLSYFTHKL